MKVEIDQSGKIEYTSVSTVVADSLGNTVLVKSTTKQYILQLYRSQNKPRLYIFHLFSLLLAILIQSSFHARQIYVIDKEYQGHEEVIAGLVIKYARILGFSLGRNQLKFALVGKKSLSHEFANKRFRRKIEGKVITLAFLKKYLLMS